MAGTCGDKQPSSEKDANAIREEGQQGEATSRMFWIQNLKPIVPKQAHSSGRLDRCCPGGCTAVKG